MAGYLLSRTASMSYIQFKGSVQRKLRWIENDVNRSLGASDCGAGHSFVVLFGFHLGFTIFPFPISTVQIIGKFWKSGVSDLAPVLLALHRKQHWCCDAPCAQGEAVRTCRAIRRSGALSQRPILRSSRIFHIRGV
jgi:hypothetical protein